MRPRIISVMNPRIICNEARDYLSHESTTICHEVQDYLSNEIQD